MQESELKRLFQRYEKGEKKGNSSFQKKFTEVTNGFIQLALTSASLKTDMIWF